MQCQSLHFPQIMLGKKITTETPLVIWKNQVESKALIHKGLVFYILKQSNIIMVLFLLLQLLVCQNFPKLSYIEDHG